VTSYTFPLETRESDSNFLLHAVLESQVSRTNGSSAVCHAVGKAVARYLAYVAEAVTTRWTSFMVARLV